MKITDAKSPILALLLSITVLVSSVACNNNQVASYVQIIGNAGSSLAGILNNPTLAAKLKTDTAAAVAAINAWKQGTPCQNVEQALQVLTADYNDIVASFGATVPPNVQALVDLALVTITAVLPLLPGCQPPAAMKAKAGVEPAKDAKDFKARWNGIIAGDPKLAGAKLK